ncbi:MAG TPA: hypothetical protein VKG38_18770 [Solirubrobacteraceae bacterium]|nr:hypothetical protein [Solirubrobacteraceae bacterium]
MGVGSLIIALPLALDGEAANSNNSALAVLSVVSMAACYVLLAALWYFVFRAKAKEKRRNRRSD